MFCLKAFTHPVCNFIITVLVRSLKILLKILHLSWSYDLTQSFVIRCTLFVNMFFSKHCLCIMKSLVCQSDIRLGLCEIWCLHECLYEVPDLTLNIIIGYILFWSKNNITIISLMLNEIILTWHNTLMMITLMPIIQCKSIYINLARDDNQTPDTKLSLQIFLTKRSVYKILNQKRPWYCRSPLIYSTFRETFLVYKERHTYRNKNLSRPQSCLRQRTGLHTNSLLYFIPPKVRTRQESHSSRTTEGHSCSSAGDWWTFDLMGDEITGFRSTPLSTLAQFS